MPPLVSVVVPVFNGERVLRRCLEACLAQKGMPTGSYEVIVVDNASTDGTGNIIDEFRARHDNVVHLTESKKGSYAARNSAIRKCRGRYVVFTDADCVPSRTWIRSYLDGLEKDPGHRLAGGAVEVIISDGNNQYEIYDKLNHLNQELFVRELGFAATANLLVERSVFDEVGLFDEELISGGDGEFGQRATASMPMLWCPDASISHGARSSLESIERKNYRIGFGLAQRHHRERGGYMPALTRARHRIPNLGYLCPGLLPWLLPRTYHPIPAGFSMRRRLLAVDLRARAAQARGRRDGRRYCEAPDEGERERIRGM